jgi:hypothetical protein
MPLADQRARKLPSSRSVKVTRDILDEFSRSLQRRVGAETERITIQVRRKRLGNTIGGQFAFSGASPAG